MKGKFIWTLEDLEILKSNYDKLGILDISKILDRTIKAVRVKGNRLGLTFKDFNKEESKCLNCQSKINDYKNNKRKFCSRSCSATYNNKRRVFEDGVKVCGNCGSKLKGTISYCSKICELENKKAVKFQEIENGLIKSSRRMKGYLIHKYGEKCMNCGWCEKNVLTNKVPIELEHVDGNSNNNNLQNLKLLCPNCHSLTSTYKALNKGNGRHKRMQRYDEGKSF